MKLLHLTIIIILTSGLVIYNNAYADNETTAYGGLVRSHQNMTSVLPSPPLETYPYTPKIFSVFQIDPEIIHPNDTSSIHILVTNNANFTLYDVNLGESVNDSKSILFSNIHKIDILNPNQTKTIYGTLHVSPDVQPTNYYDIWWNVIAKNEMGNMMESMQFHRNLPITQDLPQYYSGPVVITLESPLRQFKSGTASIDVKCNDGFLLTIKSEDDSPACVKPDTKIQLLKIGWAVPGPKDFGYNPGRGPVTLEKNIGSLSGDVSSYVYGGPLGSMTNRSSNYVVSVYMTDGITLVGKTVSDSNAHYFMHLPAGNYTIYTYNEIKQKYTISVFAGKNTVFNIKSSIHVP